MLFLYTRENVVYAVLGGQGLSEYQKTALVVVAGQEGQRGARLADLYDLITTLAR